MSLNNDCIEKLNVLEATEQWCESLETLQKLVHEQPNEVEPAVRLIYVLHNLLVENKSGGCGLGHDYLATLLLKHFRSSYKKFSGNAEFLFFSGNIMHIAEWYFGQSDEQLALRLQRRASELEPENLLFRFCYLYSKSESTTKLTEMAVKILKDSMYTDFSGERDMLEGMQ